MIAVDVSVHVIGVQTVYQSLSHNLPVDDVDFWVVDFFENFRIKLRMVVRGASLSLPVAAIEPGQVYKLTAYAVQNGVLDGMYWSDGYVYDAGQASIEFTSGGTQGGSGEAKTFSGSVQIAGKGVSRQVVAVALDTEPPYLLAQTQSSANGSYTLEWQGYAGQMLVTALDDYGADFETGLTIGVGDRVHPAAPNGYVYEAANLGTLGTEPVWPTAAGETVTSGDVVLAAVEFWRPKSSGPFSV